MNESIETICRLTAMLEVEILNLSRVFEEKTDGKIKMCLGTPCNNRLQLHSHVAAEETLSILKEWADDAALDVGWDDDYGTCYHFNIDRHPFCIVINKEATNE